MAITISNVYVQQFERIVQHLAQQSTTKLRQFVDEKGGVGEKYNFEILGTTEAVQKTSARTPTPTSDLAWSRRTAIAQTFHAGETYEPEDVVKMLVDPSSNIATALANAMRRKVDDVIISAATANALNGDGTTTAFLSTQRIGDGTGVISIDSILQVQELFNKNDVDPDEKKVMVIGPTQQRKLLQLMEVTSGDYQNARALATGVLPNWMGFDWVVSNRLLAPSAGQLDCLAFTKRALGLAINQDISAKVAPDPSISFAWRIYTSMVMGAVRVIDKEIVNLRLKDAIS